MTRAQARTSFDKTTHWAHTGAMVACGALAFAGVLLWKWERPVDAARGPAAEARAVQRPPIPHRSAPNALAQAPRAPVQPNKNERDAPEVPRPSQAAITTAAVSAADVSAATIAPLLDEAGETVAWQIVRETGALSRGDVIVAINGRGMSVGGRNELVAALENQQTVRVTLDRGRRGDSTAADEISVREQLTADAVTVPPPNCRLDPEKFRSADEFRRAVYRLSLPQNAGMCMPPPE